MLQSIQEKAKIINSSIPRTVLWSIVMTFLVISIFLFYASYLDIKSQNKIEYIKNTDTSITNYSKKPSFNAIVASKNGTKYYYLWCRGVEKIKKENIITYANEQEAKASGKELSVNCRK